MFPMEQSREHKERTAEETAFESKVRQLVHETRGLLNILKSVKGLDSEGKESQIYRITLKRFRDNCLALASLAEACSLLVSDEERDKVLGKNGCRWDQEKKRVSIC